MAIADYKCELPELFGLLPRHEPGPHPSINRGRSCVKTIRIVLLTDPCRSI